LHDTRTIRPYVIFFNPTKKSKVGIGWEVFSVTCYDEHHQ
jgi:hypothetical protein